MAKYGSILHEDVREARTRSNAGLYLVLALALAVSPVLYEEGMVLYSRWRALLGYQYSEVPTPVLNTIREHWRAVSGEVTRQTVSSMDFGHWHPSMFVPLALAMAVLGALFLRKGY